jgi:eukaryotic translation initiation factor 2C
MQPTGTSAKDFFNRTPTMVIGVDVSHSSPGSIQPSMAAITMSMDREAARYAAAVQTNGHHVEMVTPMNIRSMLTDLFCYWVRVVGGGRGPTNVYYFRDGVSEGQYMHVLDQEVSEMKKLFKELYPQGDV